MTGDYIKKKPGLRLTFDVSHWCNVHESLLGDQEETVALYLSVLIIFMQGLDIQKVRRSMILGHRNGIRQSRRIWAGGILLQKGNEKKVKDSPYSPNLVRLITYPRCRIHDNQWPRNGISMFI